MQNMVWIISLILMASIGAVFLWVAGGASRGGGDAATIAHTGYAWRGRLFWLAIIAGLALSLGTLWKWPFPGEATDPPKPDVVIRATGHQWRWELDQDTVKAGQLVEFDVTSADVNHGFAIYRNKTHLIAQTQAMPGYTNKLQVRFDQPGDYDLLCLEYCGLAHHAMRATIKVSQ